MNEIIPAILVQDEASFRERLNLVDGLADWIQLDVLDNTLYPNASWCDFEVLAQDLPKSKLELHLMVEDPGILLEGAVAAESVGRILWHVEAMGDHRELLEFVRANRVEAGLAISPDTPADALEPYRGRLDEILVMGVQPGFSGQGLIPETIEKVKRIHAAFPDVAIGFDGGVTTETIPALRSAGVTYFCAGSAIFGAEDPEAAIAALQSV